MSRDDRIGQIREAIKSYPDFPLPGIVFRDIFSLTKQPAEFADCIELFVEHIVERHPDVQVIVGLDSRGFLFGPILAQRLRLPFVPIRKAGKLPGDKISVAYELEYGKAEVEIQLDAFKYKDKVIIVDDLLATGGTMKAACELVQKLGGVILQCLLLIELNELKGRERIPADVFSLVSF